MKKTSLLITLIAAVSTCVVYTIVAAIATHALADAGEAVYTWSTMGPGAHPFVAFTLGSILALIALGVALEDALRAEKQAAEIAIAVATEHDS